METVTYNVYSVRQRIVKDEIAGNDRITLNEMDKLLDCMAGEQWKEASEFNYIKADEEFEYFTTTPFQYPIDASVPVSQLLGMLSQIEVSYENLTEIVEGEK